MLLLRDSVLRAQTDLLKADLQREIWAEDPEAWARERAHNFLWSKQREILRSVRDHRKTAVKSCHGPGKSFTAAEAIAWWLDVHPVGEASAITTAPSDSQVKTILWKEIRRVHAQAGLAGRTNQKEWLMDVPTPDGTATVEQIVAFGKKPADRDPAGFQGQHCRWVLVVFDEACGIQGKTEMGVMSLWDAADSLLSNDDCRMLVIGNPDDPGTEFEKVCRPGSGYNVISISAFETPNFTGEEIPEALGKVLVGHTWVEEKRKEWAPTWQWNEDRTAVVPPAGLKLEDAHPLWLSKVLGIFPTNKQAMGLIPVTWIEAAQRRSLVPSEPIEVGCDVGEGGDSSTAAVRRGPVVRVVHEDHNPRLMVTLGHFIQVMREHCASLVKVDKIGIGAGVVDRAREQELPFIGINVGSRPLEPERFANVRAEQYWALRERFDPDNGQVDLDPEDGQTAAELCSIRYFPNSKGQVQIESKEQAKRRGIPSPNRADAVMLSFCPKPADDDDEGGLLW
jgi:hypothetical protein